MRGAPGRSDFAARKHNGKHQVRRRQAAGRGDEINTCNRFLRTELASLPAASLVLALGLIAHNATIKALGLKQAEYVFGHAALHALPNGMRLLDSYHCSRYNTQTRRLTTPMFEKIFQQARQLVGT